MLVETCYPGRAAEEATKYSDISLRRGVPWTDAPKMLRQSANTVKQNSPTRRSMDRRAPNTLRSYSKKTSQEHASRNDHAAKIGQTLAESDQTLAEIGQHWAKFGRSARSKYEASASGCMFRVILEYGAGAC